MAKIIKKSFKFMFGRDQSWLLKEILNPGEEVLTAITSCIIRTILPPGDERSPIGMAVATNQRVILCITRVLRGIEIEEYPYDQITSIGWCTKRYGLAGCIELTVGRIKKVIFWVVPKTHAEWFIQVVQEKVAEARNES